MIFPGMVDVHVHLRTPGGEHKEDFRTGSAAALAGGFTMLLAMPNTQPPLVTLESWQSAQTRAQSESLCDVFLYAGASANHIDQLPVLAQHAPALKIYMDQTYGPLYVRAGKPNAHLLSLASSQTHLRACRGRICCLSHWACCYVQKARAYLPCFAKERN